MSEVPSTTPLPCAVGPLLVAVHDVCDMWSAVLEARVTANLPLRAVSWVDPATDEKWVVDRMPVKFVVEPDSMNIRPRQPRDAGRAAPVSEVDFEVENVLGRFEDGALHRAPVVRVRVFSCNTLDAYKQVMREQLRAWVNAVDQAGYEWLLVLTSGHASPSDPVKRAQRKVHAQLRADFLVEREGDRVVRMDALPDDTEKSTDEFLTKLRSALLDGLDDRVRQHVDRARALAAQRSAPGWTLLPYWLVRESLASLLARAGLLALAAREYGWIELELLRAATELDLAVSEPDSCAPREAAGDAAAAVGVRLGCGLRAHGMPDVTTCADPWRFQFQRVQAAVARGDASLADALCFTGFAQVRLHILVSKLSEAVAQADATLCCVSRRLRADARAGAVPVEWPDQWAFSAAYVLASRFSEQPLPPPYAAPRPWAPPVPEGVLVWAAGSSPRHPYHHLGQLYAAALRAARAQFARGAGLHVREIDVPASFALRSAAALAGPDPAAASEAAAQLGTQPPRSSLPAPRSPLPTSRLLLM